MGASRRFDPSTTVQTLRLDNSMFDHSGSSTGATFAFWYYYLDSNIDETILAINSSNKLIFKTTSGERFRTNEGISYTEAAPGSMDANAWNHIAWTTSGNVISTDTIRLYHNATEVTNGTLSFSLNSPNNFTVGSLVGFGQPIDGYMAYLGIWNRELSADEIREVMSRPYAIPGGMQHLIPMRGSSTTIEDDHGSAPVTNTLGPSTTDPPTESFVQGPPVFI